MNLSLKDVTHKELEKAHIAIHDLHYKINFHCDLYHRKKIASVVYRGTVISKGEIEEIKNNLGEDIEMLAFGSTSLN